MASTTITPSPLRDDVPTDPFTKAATHTNTDAVVVGGGMAGLIAACYLARGGLSVTLFEKASSLGGRAATQRVDGFAINRGIHALYTGGATSEVLAELGVTYSAGVPKTTFGLQGGRLYPFPTSPAALLTSRLLGLGEKLELIRLLAGLSRIDARSLARTSVQQWLDETIRRPRARRVFTALARVFVYSAALDLVSADVFVDRLQRSLKHRVEYVDGGWQTLVDGLRRVASDAGARIVSGTRVESLAHRDGHVAGVRLHDGTFVGASAVILATTPQEAAPRVDGSAHPLLRRMVDALVPAQVACLDVALRALPRPRYPIVWDLDGPRFFTTQSRYARVAPEGGALVHAFKQLDPRQPSSAAGDERDLEAFLDAAQPGWRHVVMKRVSLPRIAAAGALPLAASGGFAGRPGPEVPGIEGLLLAGDWIGSEGFLADASAASARRAAHLALESKVGAARGSLRGRLSVA